MDTPTLWTIRKLGYITETSCPSSGRTCGCSTLISTETHVPSPWCGQYRTHVGVACIAADILIYGAGDTLDEAR